MIPRTLTYPSKDRELYRQGILYGHWKRRYQRTTLFKELLESEATTKQFPVKRPPLKSQTYGFGELFAGILYINLGFDDAIRYYYYREQGYESYEMAIKILGAGAAEFICCADSQPPDLLIVDKKGRFFFVEAKLPPDRLNGRQKKFFPRLESYLNHNVPRTKLAPHMPKGNWIELLTLKPL